MKNRSTAIFDMFVSRHGEEEGRKKFQEWSDKMQSTRKTLQAKNEEYEELRQKKAAKMLTKREVAMMQVSVRKAYYTKTTLKKP